MMVLFIAMLVWFAVFMIGSYSGIVNGSTWGILVTSICLFIMFAALAFKVVFA